jgi:CO/xanthine dehydrogenase Mo-binding subunit
MTSTPDMGQGIRTGLFQIIRNEFGVQRSDVEFDLLDTSALPESSGCSAQRMMFCTGNALILAINKLKEKILAVIENKLSLTAKNLSEIRDGKFFYTGPTSQKQSVSFKEIANILKEENQTLEAQEVYFGPETHSLEDRNKINENQYKLYPTYSFTAAVVTLAVEEKTGRVKVIEINTFQDVGRAINPATVKMQLEGCCIQGLGYALKEQYVLKEGIPTTLSFSKLGVPKITDAPRFKTVLIEYPERIGPHGAKGISETAILAVCPAITNGIADAIGIRISSLPASSTRIKSVS